MTREQQKHVFENFYRVPTNDRHDVKGFGIGLNYVMKMVKKHHGKIQLKSELGSGSTLEFTSQLIKMQGNKVNLLFVEDDTNLGFVIKDQLEMAGYAVTWAQNGADGLKCCLIMILTSLFWMLCFLS